jgi:hypothetical protein
VVSTQSTTHGQGLFFFFFFDPKNIRLVDYAKLRKTGHCMETMTVRRDWLCTLTIMSGFLDTEDLITIRPVPCQRVEKFQTYFGRPRIVHSIHFSNLCTISSQQQMNGRHP